MQAVTLPGNFVADIVNLYYKTPSAELPAATLIHRYTSQTEPYICFISNQMPLQPEMIVSIIFQYFPVRPQKILAPL